MPRAFVRALKHVQGPLLRHVSVWERRREALAPSSRALLEFLYRAQPHMRRSVMLQPMPSLRLACVLVHAMRTPLTL